MRRAATLAVFATLALTTALTPAIAAGVDISMDQVKVIAFTKPVSTVFLGNTVIADVNMIDAHHAFLLGKTYGATNLVALGSDGTVVINERVTVAGTRTGLVTLNRGAEQFNYSCTAHHCETQPIPGDPIEYFKNTHDAQQQHEDMGTKAAVTGAVAANTTPQ